MPNTTSRLLLQQPLTSDPDTALRTSITNNAATLDNSTITTEGTFSARPAAGAVEHNRIYHATDTGQWYVSDGTNWRLLVSGIDSGWTVLSPFYGLNISTAGTAGGFTPSARAVGQTARLRGMLKATASIAGNAAVVTLPSTFRPASVVYHVVTVGAAGSMTGVQCSIDTSGNLTVPAGVASGAQVSLDPILYDLT